MSIVPNPPGNSNLPHAGSALLYAGIGLVEGANVSVGRGTPTPFELIGAPWIEAGKLAATLTARHLPGLAFRSADFTPAKDIYANQPCHGIRVTVTDPGVADLPRLGIEMIAALYRLYPDRFEIDATEKIIGSQAIFRQIKDQVSPDEIAAAWRDALTAYDADHQKYLLYPARQ